MNGANPGDPLTDLERETLSLLALGWRAKHIAQQEGVSPAAVNNRLFRAAHKLGTASGTATVIEAIRQGEIPFPRPDAMLPRLW